MPYAAVAQAQQLNTISHQESLELVRCLMRVSIFHVSYLRGFYPEKCFKNVQMRNLDDMNIKMLTPSCDESKRMVDWVEKGVYDALRKGYLKTLYFGAARDANSSNLMEEYIFQFTYGEDGLVELDMTGGAANGKKKGDKFGEARADVAAVRYQVCRLMRMLVQITNTLDKVPDERYLFMKMTYHDHTPEDYEPPFFQAADQDAMGYFIRKPFHMHVGTVATEHHQVGLRVKSTLDGLQDEDVADGQEQEEVFSQHVSTSMGATDMEGTEVISEANNGAEQRDDMKQEDAASKPPLKAPVAHDQDHAMGMMTEGQIMLDNIVVDDGAEEDVQAAKEHPMYDTVKAFCMQRSQVDVTDAMARYMELKSQVVERFFESLVAEGVLQPIPNKCDLFKVLIRSASQPASQSAQQQPQQQQQQPAAVALPAQDLAQHMTSLSVADVQKDAPSRRGRQTNVPLTSQCCNDTSNPAGSEHTNSKTPKRAMKRGISDQDSIAHEEEAQPVYHFDASQHSNKARPQEGIKRMRKASCVAAPIHQTAAQKKAHQGTTTRATRSRLAAMG